MQEIRDIESRALLARDFFVGPSNREMHKAMDKRAAEVARGGKGVTIYRTAIGRNATCPCGSGQKFKRCCLDKAQIVGA
jgi:uncharacterized protein YchJ